MSLVPFLAVPMLLSGVSLAADPDPSVMSAAYWEKWNAAEQARIDADIEKHRMADCVFSADGLKPGTEVTVEQLSHDFIFGAHIFNFDQLGADKLNEAYKALYGTLFNSATVPFYWREFEPEEGKMRFDAEARDTAAFWNNCSNPKHQFHWRRPAPGPIVDFCERKGIRAHGHVLAWGNYMWQVPQWITDKAGAELDFMQGATRGNNDWSPKGTGGRDELQRDKKAIFEELSIDELQRQAPNYIQALNDTLARRIYAIALRYGDRIQSWDVANESATDYGAGRLIPGDKICKSHYGPMPGDYAYRAFKLAESVFPSSVKLNINDYVGDHRYYSQVTNMLARGCKIDIVGSQMHLFDPNQIVAISKGDDIETPEIVRKRFELLGRIGRPIHLSEITITSPTNTPCGLDMQAIVARNLYRLWFSLKPMMGITWWNVVDDCGAPGEPSVSGLFTRQMQPKPAYFALDKLINHEWRTNLKVTVSPDGKVKVRGFKGRYRLTWKEDGKTRCSEITVR